jgi:hypothetical protein
MYNPFTIHILNDLVLHYALQLYLTKRHDKEELITVDHIKYDLKFWFTILKDSKIRDLES